MHGEEDFSEPILMHHLPLPSLAAEGMDVLQLPVMAGTHFSLFFCLGCSAVWFAGGHCHTICHDNFRLINSGTSPIESQGYNGKNFLPALP